MSNKTIILIIFSILSLVILTTASYLAVLSNPAWVYFVLLFFVIWIFPVMPLLKAVGDK